MDIFGSFIDFARHASQPGEKCNWSGHSFVLLEYNEEDMRRDKMVSTATVLVDGVFTTRVVRTYVAYADAFSCDAALVGYLELCSAEEFRRVVGAGVCHFVRGTPGSVPVEPFLDMAPELAPNARRSEFLTVVGFYDDSGEVLVEPLRVEQRCQDDGSVAVRVEFSSSEYPPLKMVIPAM